MKQASLLTLLYALIPKQRVPSLITRFRTRNHCSCHIITKYFQTFQPTKLISPEWNSAIVMINKLLIICQAVLDKWRIQRLQ